MTFERQTRGIDELREKDPEGYAAYEKYYKLLNAEITTGIVSFDRQEKIAGIFEGINDADTIKSMVEGLSSIAPHLAARNMEIESNNQAAA